MCADAVNVTRGPGRDRRELRYPGAPLEQVQADPGHPGAALARALLAHIRRGGGHRRQLERHVRPGQASRWRERGLHLVGVLRWAHAWPHPLDVD